VKLLRFVLIALGLSLLAGFLIGTAIRMRAERPERYIGSAVPAHPLDVGDARATVLEARQDEQQV